MVAYKNKTKPKSAHTHKKTSTNLAKCVWEVKGELSHCFPEEQNLPHQMLSQPAPSTKRWTDSAAPQTPTSLLLPTGPSSSTARMEGWKASSADNWDFFGLQTPEENVLNNHAVITQYYINRAWTCSSWISLWLEAHRVKVTSYPVWFHHAPSSTGLQVSYGQQLGPIKCLLCFSH